MGLLDFFTRKRESTYTDTASNAFLSAIQGAYTGAESASATETAAGMWERALAAATVLPSGAAANALTPELLGLIGRSFVRKGELVLVIDVDENGILLLPASGHTIEGGANPASWTYEATVPGPSGATVVKRGSEGVVHLRYAIEAARPWRGISPLGFAASTGRLYGGLEKNLANEAAGASGYILPMPSDPANGIYDKLKTDLKNAAGGTTFAETTSAGGGEGRAAAPLGDFHSRRYGLDVPAANVSLRADVEQCVLSIHGISPSLVQSNSDGTAQRESLRRFVYTTIEPIAKNVAAEVGRKLNAPGLTLSFDDLRANDLMAQMRAWRAGVGAREGSPNMTDEEARRLVRFDA